MMIEKEEEEVQRMGFLFLLGWKSELFQVL